MFWSFSIRDLQHLLSLKKTKKVKQSRLYTESDNLSALCDSLLPIYKNEVFCDQNVIYVLSCNMF